MNKPTIIDVITPEEYTMEHFPKAINIPLEQIPQRLYELKEMPKPIIAYCRSGNRSSIAISIIKQSGILENLNGGGLDEMKQSMRDQ